MPTWQVVGWAVLGAGGVGLVGSGVLAALTSGDGDGDAVPCTNEPCPAARDGSSLDAPTIGFIAAAGLLGVGIVIVLTHPSSGKSTQVALSPVGLSLGGRF